jgi:hypothetical protein
MERRLTPLFSRFVQGGTLLSTLCESASTLPRPREGERVGERGRTAASLERCLKSGIVLRIPIIPESFWNSGTLCRDTPCGCPRCGKKTACLSRIPFRKAGTYKGRPYTGFPNSKMTPVYRHENRRRIFFRNKKKGSPRVNADRVMFVVKVRPNPGGAQKGTVGQR